MVDVRRSVLLAVLAACYSPSPPAGSPCSDTEPCPSTLTCSPVSHTCELQGGTINDAPMALHDSPRGMIDAPRVDASSDADTLMLCGTGVNPPCPPNDLPSGAIDVTAGGTFTADIRFAHDDASPGGGTLCGNAGGRDVFYEATTGFAEVWYFDTLGSDFDSVIRVYSGPCVSGAGSGQTCHDNACGGTQTQWVGTISAGTSCIVVDQASSSVTNGSLVLHVERGHHNGTKIMTGAGVKTTGDTTSTGDNTTPACASAGNDQAFYFTTCPGNSFTAHATTCNAATTWDTALEGAGPTGATACNDDDATCSGNQNASTISFATPGAHLWWLIVDAGATGAFGPFELDTTIQ